MRSLAFAAALAVVSLGLVAGCAPPEPQGYTKGDGPKPAATSAPPGDQTTPTAPTAEPGKSGESAAPSALPSEPAAAGKTGG